MEIDISDTDSLDHGLNFLADRLSDSKSFLADIQLPEYGDYFEYPFPIQCKNDIELPIDWTDFGNHNELYFYCSAIQNEKSDEIANIIELIIDLNNYIKQNYATDCIWENNEIPFGLFPAGLLALSDKRYIDLFIKFLETNDLDHETYHYDMIRNIVENHGWCLETLKLAFCRATSLVGQHGLNQFDEFLSDMDLDHFLTTEEGIQIWFSLKTSVPEDELDDVLEMVDLALRDIRAYEDQKSEGFDNQLEGMRVHIISQNWFDSFKEAVLYIIARGAMATPNLDDNTEIALSTELDWPENQTAKAQQLGILRLWKTVTTRKEAKETLRRIYEKFESAMDNNDRDALSELLENFSVILKDHTDNGQFERIIHRRLKTADQLKGVVYLVCQQTDKRWLYETLHAHDIGRIIEYLDESDNPSIEFLNQALLLAISQKNVEAVDRLILLGADLALARGIGDQGVMEWAFWSGNAPKQSVVKTLLEHGANANEKSAKGKTPLMYAFSKIGQTSSSFEEWKEVIDLLIGYGADILERDKQGNCILDYAKTLSANSHGELKHQVDNLIERLF